MKAEEPCASLRLKLPEHLCKLATQCFHAMQDVWQWSLCLLTVDRPEKDSDDSSHVYLPTRRWFSEIQRSWDSLLQSFVFPMISLGVQQQHAIQQTKFCARIQCHRLSDPPEIWNLETWASRRRMLYSVHGRPALLRFQAMSAIFVSKISTWVNARHHAML